MNRKRRHKGEGRGRDPKRGKRNSKASACSNGLLEEVIRTGDLQAAKLLSNADVDKIDGKTGKTALFSAAGLGNLPLVVFLVSERGADVNKGKKNGSTPLINATRRGHLPVVKFLVNSGAALGGETKPSMTPLVKAARHGHLSIVEYLVSAGAYCPEYAAQALCLASGRGHLDIAKFLIEKVNLDVNLRGHRSDLTPLNHASGRGQLDVVKYLVSECGADASKWSTNSLKCPLFSAINANHQDVVKVLVSSGKVDVNGIRTADELRQSPLVVASKRGYLEIVKTLTKGGAVIDVPGEERTALFAAAEYGRLCVVKHLIGAGANISHVSANRGRTVLDAAIIHDQDRVIEFLAKETNAPWTHSPRPGPWLVMKFVRRWRRSHLRRTAIDDISHATGMSKDIGAIVADFSDLLIPLHRLKK